jgi:hypothetical protein
VTAKGLMAERCTRSKLMPCNNLQQWPTWRKQKAAGYEPAALVAVSRFQFVIFNDDSGGFRPEPATQRRL